MTTRLPHYKRIAKMLRKRVLHGDYSIKSVPSERVLAQEFGVNFMTARRGLQLLIEEGLLERRSNGRISVVGKCRPGTGHVALLIPYLVSARIEEWRLSLVESAHSMGIAVRTVLYVHWDDPVLVDALNGFDGIFLLPAAEAVPAEVVAKLQKSNQPVVVLDEDFSNKGLPSILPFPATSVQILLDHFASKGLRRIDCFNAQPEHPPVNDRISQWKFWMASHHYKGKLHNYPVLSGKIANEHAYFKIQQILQNQDFNAEALFCVTVGSAIAAIRAFADIGIHAGKDIAVATVDGEGISQLYVPTITCLKTPNIQPYLRYCLDWMISDNESWDGPLLMSPPSLSLCVGESTVTTAGKSRK